MKARAHFAHFGNVFISLNYVSKATLNLFRVKEQK
jgi:hypothetical protein